MNVGMKNGENRIGIDRTKYWLSVGAQPTEPVLKLFSRVCVGSRVISIDRCIARIPSEAIVPVHKAKEASRGASGGGEEGLEGVRIRGEGFVGC